VTVVQATGLVAVRGGRRILAGVDLDLRRGETTVLLGPNGAGKSTLVGLLAGLSAPDGGAVARSGRVAAALQTPALARRTALANVEAALAWWRVPRGERRERALDALDALRVAHVADRPAAALSGGERRRVHLARALATRPDALLLDEPFAGLDAATRADLLYDARSALAADERATLVVVHDRAEAWALADRVLVLLDGRIVDDGPPRRVFTEPPNAAAARFVGFDGAVTDGADVLLTRPEDVVLGGGTREGTVVRAVPLEDGVRVEIALDGGRVVARAPHPAPAPGTVVRVEIAGGRRYPPDAAGLAASGGIG